MNNNTELLSKSGIIKSMIVSLIVAIVSTIIYSRIENIPIRTESVWAVFFTSGGLSFIVCMAAMVVYSQFDHEHHHYH